MQTVRVWFLLAHSSHASPHHISRFLILYQSVHPLTTTGLAPLFLLATLNFKMFFRPGSNLSNKRDLQLAKIVGTVVLVFLVLNMPRVVIGVFELTRLALINV